MDRRGVGSLVGSVLMRDKIFTPAPPADPRFDAKGQISDLGQRLIRTERGRVGDVEPIIIGIVSPYPVAHVGDDKSEHDDAEDVDGDCHG